MCGQRGIRIGVHYEYPFGGMARRPEWLPQGEDDWRRDLEMIKDTGFDSIRIRIGLDSSLDDVERLLDLCLETGLGVLFGFATFYVNDSFVEEYPDSKVVDRQGVAYPTSRLDYRWQRVCIDHPEYRHRRNQLLVDCASRFGQHPAVLDWDVHNEPGIGPGDHPCYCVHTVTKYRKDLVQRLGSVDALNERFGTSYHDWSEVEPPRDPSAARESFWRDWREFMARDLSEFLLEGAALIRQHAPGVRVSYNVTYAFAPERNGQDWWVTPEMDYLSTSLYRSSGPQTGASAGSHLALLKAMAPAKDLYVVEFQGGPMGRDMLWRGINIDAEMNQVFSQGVRGLYFYRWDPLMCGPEPLVNGIVDVDKYDTERRLAIKRIVAELREDEALLADAHTVQPRVAIYLTRAMVWDAGARHAGLNETVAGLYGLFLDLGYEVGFITNAAQLNNDLALVAVPFTFGLSDDEQSAIDRFMAQGGQVVAELPLTSLDDCSSTGKWLGMECRDLEHPIYGLWPGWSYDDAPGRFGGFAFFDRVLLSSHQGRAIASYRHDGEPALLVNGPDDRMLIPTFALGRSYFASLHRGIRRSVKAWLPKDIVPDIEIDGVPDEYRSLVEARIVEGSAGALLFAINRSGYNWTVVLGARGYEPLSVELPHYGAIRKRAQKS